MGKNRKLRIALIGCGGMSGVHAAALLKDERVEITRLVDTSPRALKNFKSGHPMLAGLPEHSDYREALDEVDAVTIQTPHTVHYEQIMNALDHGLHVLCEKPLVCTVAHAKKVIEKVRRSRRKLQVAYQRRASDQFNYIRNEIASGSIGKLEFISVVLCQQWKCLTKGLWRQDPKLSGGGQLNDSGSHIMDMLLFLANQKPVTVAAFDDNRGTKVDIDTTASIRFDKGALASVSVIGDARNWDERWFISGSKGMLMVDNGLKRIDESGGQAHEITQPGLNLPQISINWVDAICGKAKLLSPAKSVLGVVKLTEAIWKSAAAGGKPVRV